jgi:hypothetical protein
MMTGHSLHPHGVDRHTWFYDETGGLLIVHEIHDDKGRYIQTEHIKIRWQSIMAAAKRHLEEIKK